MSTQDGELTIHPSVQNVGGGYPGSLSGWGVGGEKPDSLPNYSPSLGQGSPCWTLMCSEGLKRGRLDCKRGGVVWSLGF